MSGFRVLEIPKKHLLVPVLVFLNRHFPPSSHACVVKLCGKTGKNMRTGGLWKRELCLSHQCWSNRNPQTKWLFQRKMPVNRAAQSGTRVPLGCARALRPAKVRGDSGDDDGIHGWWSSQSRGWSADITPDIWNAGFTIFQVKKKNPKIGTHANSGTLDIALFGGHIGTSIPNHSTPLPLVNLLPPQGFIKTSQENLPDSSDNRFVGFLLPGITMNGFFRSKSLPRLFPWQSGVWIEDNVQLGLPSLGAVIEMLSMGMHKPYAEDA